MMSAAIRAATLCSSFSLKLAQQKDDAVIIDVLIHIGTSFLNFALRHKYEDRPVDKERNRSQAVQIKERSGRSPYFCRKAEKAAP